MRAKDIDFGDIFLEKKSYKTYKNILIYYISYKTFMGSIPLRIMFEKRDGFTIIYDGVRYSVIVGHNWLDEIWDSIIYLVSGKSGIFR